MSETRILAAGAEGTLDIVLDTLKAAEPVAMPSETVYGLFADATSATAVARIYAAKGRPAFNPLIAHCASQQMAETEGVFNDDALKLADHFWPGPLTLVVPRRDAATVCDLACGGLRSVALRVPSSPTLADVLKRFGRPLAGPSANRSGRLSPTSASAVSDDLDGIIPVIVDGGDAPVGLESTIVACQDGIVRILRPGTVLGDDIEAIVGKPLSETEDADAGTIEAPGQMASHYAPDAPLRLNAREVREGEALLAFGPHMPDGASNAVEILNLSVRGDLTRAAASLYRNLRALDRFAPAAIAVMPIPNHGLGVAIMDRLQRAAAPRDQNKS